MSTLISRPFQGRNRWMTIAAIASSLGLALVPRLAQAQGRYRTAPSYSPPPVTYTPRTNYMPTYSAPRTYSPPTYTQRTYTPPAPVIRSAPTYTQRTPSYTPPRSSVDFNQLFRNRESSIEARSAAEAARQSLSSPSAPRLPATPGTVFSGISSGRTSSSMPPALQQGHPRAPLTTTTPETSQDRFKKSNESFFFDHQRNHDHHHHDLFLGGIGFGAGLGFLGGFYGPAYPFYSPFYYDPFGSYYAPGGIYAPYDSGFGYYNPYAFPPSYDQGQPGTQPLPNTPDNYRIGEREAKPDPAVETAIGDIERAWRDNALDLLSKHVRRDTKIAVYQKGKLQYTLESSDYLDRARDAFENTTTIQFELNKPHRTGPDTYAVTGRHIYQDKDGKEHTVFVTFSLQKIDGEYIITQAGVTPE